MKEEKKTREKGNKPKTEETKKKRQKEGKKG